VYGERGEGGMWGEEGEGRVKGGGGKGGWMREGLCARGGGERGGGWVYGDVGGEKDVQVWGRETRRFVYFSTILGGEAGDFAIG